MLCAATHHAQKTSFCRNSLQSLALKIFLSHLLRYSLSLRGEFKIDVSFEGEHTTVTYFLHVKYLWFSVFTPPPLQKATSLMR